MGVNEQETRGIAALYRIFTGAELRYELLPVVLDIKIQPEDQQNFQNFIAQFFSLKCLYPVVNASNKLIWKSVPFRLPVDSPSPVWYCIMDADQQYPVLMTHSAYQTALALQARGAEFPEGASHNLQEKLIIPFLLRDFEAMHLSLKQRQQKQKKMPQGAAQLQGVPSQAPELAPVETYLACEVRSENQLGFARVWNPLLCLFSFIVLNYAIHDYFFADWRRSNQVMTDALRKALQRRRLGSLFIGVCGVLSEAVFFFETYDALEVHDPAWEWLNPAGLAQHAWAANMMMQCIIVAAMWLCYRIRDLALSSTFAAAEAGEAAFTAAFSVIRREESTPVPLYATLTPAGKTYQSMYSSNSTL